MANIDNELIKRHIIPAIENAIRLEHLEDGAAGEYKVKELARVHLTLVRKVYRSEEMRGEHYLAESIRKGTDFGTHFVRGRVKGEIK